MGSEVRPDGPLSVEQTGALIAELLGNTPGGRLGQDEIGDALATIGELYASAAMVAVVQLVEHQVVILEVAGSSPVSHPD
jgi:hypothetical protein